MRIINYAFILCLIAGSFVYAADSGPTFDDIEGGMHELGASIASRVETLRDEARSREIEGLLQKLELMNARLEATEANLNLYNRGFAIVKGLSGEDVKKQLKAFFDKEVTHHCQTKRELVATEKELADMREQFERLRADNRSLSGFNKALKAENSNLSQSDNALGKAYNRLKSSHAESEKKLSTAWRNGLITGAAIASGCAIAIKLLSGSVVRQTA